MNSKQPLTIETLIQEAVLFATLESRHQEPILYGVTDGKAVGTYLDRNFAGIFKSVTHLRQATRRQA